MREVSVRGRRTDGASIGSLGTAGERSRLRLQQSSSTTPHRIAAAPPHRHNQRAAQPRRAHLRLSAPHPHPSPPSSCRRAAFGGCFSLSRRYARFDRHRSTPLAARAFGAASSSRRRTTRIHKRSLAHSIGQRRGHTIAGPCTARQRAVRPATRRSRLDDWSRRARPTLVPCELCDRELHEKRKARSTHTSLG